MMTELGLTFNGAAPGGIDARFAPSNDSAWVTLAHSLLGLGMKHLAVYSLAVNDVDGFSKVRQVLLDYSRSYAGYRVHKLFAQTLGSARRRDVL